MLREARTAFDPGPEPYKHLDLGLATRLAGGIWLIAVFHALIVLPFSPPDGLLAWGATGLIVVLAANAGAHLLRRPEPLGPDMLYAVCFAGIGAAIAFRVAAGPGAPFPQFLFLACLYASAVHTPRRAVTIFAVATLAAFTPLVVGSVLTEFWARTVAQIALWWSLGAVVLLWSLRMRRLRAEVHDAREAAEQHARVDPLTGLGNRRALEETIVTMAAAARRYGHPLSALVADLDSFKEVNDTYGHGAGDAMLVGVAAAIKSSLRLPDPCFRWGGDEFIALLPDTALEQARATAERIVSDVAEGVEAPDGTPVRVSIGVAELAEGESPDALLARADRELILIKNARRAKRTLETIL